MPQLTTPARDSDPLTGTPAVLYSDMTDPALSQSRLDSDLHAMLQALPTKAEIEFLILRIEEAHSRDIQEVRTKLTMSPTG